MLDRCTCGNKAAFHTVIQGRVVMLCATCWRKLAKPVTRREVASGV